MTESNLCCQYLKYLITIVKKFKNNTILMANVGIGLFTVKKIIELHQDSIEAESEYSKWMRFIISLPMN